MSYWVNDTGVVIPHDVFVMLVAFDAIDKDGTFDPERHEQGRLKFLAYAESKLTEEELRHFVVSGDPSDPRDSRY